jgi:signal transduction histidine kinase
MSSKFRLTAWITVMMLLMFATSMTLLIITDKNIVTDDPGSRVVDVVWRNVRHVEYDNMRFDWEDIDYYRQGVYCAVYDANGGLLKGAFPDGFTGQGAALEDSVVRTVSENGRNYYVYDVRWNMDVTTIWLRGMIDASANYNSMSTIITLAFTVLPAILVLGVLGGWLISKNTFMPMDYIMEKAASISGGDDLSARIGLKKGPTEMVRLSDTFDGMFGRLEASFESEKKFASDASHELRTPTTVILAECDSAKKKANTKEDFDKAISVIQEQGNKMSHMISQLLSITRLEQGTERIRVKQADLSVFTESCCGEFVPKDARGIKLSTSIEPGIMAAFDLGLMSRVIQNLLENAYKYGRENGHILVSLRRSGGVAVLAVKDDGIGIADEDKPNIWKRFWQADASRGEDEGVGLGLSMVKQICEYHGGSVDVESEPGRGSTFTVRLPLA